MGLPTEYLDGVLMCVGLGDRAAAMAVSRAWRAEVEGNPRLWRKLDGRRVFATYGARGVAVLRALLDSARWSQVEEVNLECCKLASDAEVASLERFGKTLTVLNLNATHNVSPEAVTRLVRKCGRLHVLELYWHPRLGDEALAGLAASPSVGTLRELNISGCQRVTDAGLGPVLRSCRRLEVLDVTRCPRLTDASLRVLAEARGRGLRKFVAYANSSFTDAGFGALANAGLQRLEELDVCGAKLLTSAALEAVVRKAGAALRVLNCSWCVSLDDRAGLAIAKYCTALRLLSFHGINAISDVAIDAMAASAVATTLRTLDVSGCSKISDYRRQAGRLAARFPNVSTWVVHR